MKESASDVLKRFGTTLRSSPVDRVLAASGLRPAARRAYWWAVVNLAGPQSVTVEGATAEFDVHSATEYWRTQTLFEEQSVIEDVLAELEPDDVFYDIGANIGIYSCLATGVLQEGQVVAFEPHPETRERLRANLARNGGNYTVCPYALSDTDGTATIGTAAGSERPGTYSLRKGEGESAVGVEVVRGDTLLSEGELPPPDVLKIDVEGAELAVVDGLRETLTGGECRTVYVEIHGTSGGSNDAEDDIASLLSEAGFDVTRIHAREGEHFLRARR